MLIVSPERRGLFPEVVDSTIRNEFNKCQTSGYWSFVRKLGSKGGSVDLIAGGCFAKGLETIRKAVWEENLPFPQALEKGMHAAIIEWGAFVCPPYKEQKNLQRVVQALDEYFKRWPINEDPIKPFFWSPGRAGVEFTFAIPLPVSHPTTGNPIIYAGRLDLLGLYSNQLFLVDEKTASQLGPTWGTKWGVRGQFTGYIWAARQTGLQCAGAIVRGVSFLKNSFGFAESIQRRSNFEIDAWYAQTVSDIEEAKIAWAKGEYRQAFGDACEGYSGCAFMDLCKQENPEPWTVNYGHRDWNPLSKYPEGKPDTDDDPGAVVPLGFQLPK